jgi:hypothetical protein
VSAPDGNPPAVLHVGGQLRGYGAGSWQARASRFHLEMSLEFVHTQAGIK